MKVVQQTKQNDQNRAKRSFTSPVIGLERPSEKDHVKGHYETLKLRNHPEKGDTSPQFSFVLDYYGTGTPEEFLLYEKGLKKVMKGQGLIIGPDKFETTRRTLEGDALATFNDATLMQNDESIESYQKSMNVLKKHVFPARAMQMQKRWMRRFLRKPKDKTIREHVARVREINSYFPLYPMMDDAKKKPEGLDDDELLDLLEYGCPNSWQKEMVKQGFDTTNATIPTFCEFCERIEKCESIDPHNHSNNNNNNNSPDKAQKGRKNKYNNKRKDKDSSEDGSQTRKKQKNSFWCMQHGDNSTHNTNKCEYIKSQLKRLKGTYEAQHPSKRKEFKQKQELQMLIGEIADKAVKKVNENNKKRRAACDNSSDEESHNIEELNNQLKKVTFQMNQDSDSE
jgi:hypothetical protein